MPVNGLEGFIASKTKATYTDPIETTFIPEVHPSLGIDGTMYLNKLWTRPAIKTALSSALGGLPTTFQSEVEADIKQLKAYNLNPQFFFDGLDLLHFSSKDKNYKGDPSIAKRWAAWEAWTKLAEKGRFVDATDRAELVNATSDAFEVASALTPQLRLIAEKELFRICLRHDVPAHVAPISAKAQLVRWHHGSVTNITWSDPDIFVYDMPRIVTDFDWEAKTFTYVRKDSIQTYKAGAFPEDYTAFTEAFLDACILAGGVYDCPVLPSLAGSLTSMGPVFTFERAIDVLRTYNYDGATTIKESLPDSKEYLSLYAKTKAMITYMPIKKNDGRIVTLVRHNAPNDLAMVITPRLADSIYLMFYHRLVRPTIYDFLISDNIQIHAPLEGGDTLEYRNLLTEMIPIQTQCLALVASHSNRFMHHKHLTATYWYQPEARVDFPPYHSFNLNEAPYGKTKTWHVRSKTLASIAKDLRGWMLALRNPENARRTINKEEGDREQLVSHEEIIANAYWKTLQLRFFINGDNHHLMPWGIALTDGLEKLHDQADLHDALVLALELFRLKILHHDDFSIKYPDAAMNVTGIGCPHQTRLMLDEEKKHIRFVCRLACTASLSAPPERWQGPISRTYLAFHSMVTEFQSHLRSLVEMVTLSMCVQYDVLRADRPNIEWTQIGQKLPFGALLDTMFALLIRCKLEDLVLQHRNASVPAEKQINLIEVTDWASLCPLAPQEVARMFAFWDAFVCAVKSAKAASARFHDNSEISDELSKITDTDSWLAALRD